MSGSRRISTKKLVVLALLSAIGFISMMLLKIPVVSFLKYEPKDIFITLAGFLYGPLSSMAVAAVTALLEFPISETGVIGLVMNFLSSASFACVASLIYHKRDSLSSAVIGLLCGMASMTTAMMLWNYLISPLYYHMPRTDVVPMLTTVFLPFNLIKSGINASLTMLLYQPFMRVLVQCGFVSEKYGATKQKRMLSVMLVSLLIFVGCCVVIYFMNHK